jgi:hypothetical protein
MHISVVSGKAMRSWRLTCAVWEAAASPDTVRRIPASAGRSTGAADRFAFTWDEAEAPHDASRHDSAGMTAAFRFMGSRWKTRLTSYRGKAGGVRKDDPQRHIVVHPPKCRHWEAERKMTSIHGGRPWYGPGRCLNSGPTAALT